jgi:hypothetical protein
MSITTSQQIAKYYDTFISVPVVFTKELIAVTGLIPQQVFLKCTGEQWPCVIYSTSFKEAKLIINTRGGLREKIDKSNNVASLRFCFRAAGKNDSLTFYVGGKVLNFSPYNAQNTDVSFMNLAYTQRPPDDLIDILGQIIETNINSAKRKEERILITPDSVRRLGIASKDTVVYIQGVPRKCILRDLSFSGAKLIMFGIAKFLMNKELILRIELEEPQEYINIRGTAIRSEDVEGRRDLAAIAVHFDDGQVPMSYKLHVNACLTQSHKGEDLWELPPEAEAKVPNDKTQAAQIQKAAWQQAQAESRNKPT